MKQKDSIDRLFHRLEGKLDLHDTPTNHEKRFLAKLRIREEDAKPESGPQGLRWWKPLSIAASVLLLVFVGLFLQRGESAPEGLASVSPEMEETQSFFTTAINAELETLHSFQDAGSQKLIADTMNQLSILENEYDNLKVDLVESGNDKRVIAAMIENFQNRIELLQQVIITLDEIKTLKANTNETTI